MDDARRFLRYVLPGVAFAIQTCILLALLRPDLIPTALSLFGKESALGAVVGALFVTGGLGYLFSVIHHTIHWRQSASTIDHRENIKRLAAEGLIQPKDVPNKMNREDAWVLTSILWYENRTENKLIEGADENARTLTDLAHMLGTTRVASALALIFAYIIAAAMSSFSLEIEPILRFFAALVLGLFVYWVTSASYQRTSRFANRVIDGVLYNALQYAKQSPGPDKGKSP
jgi:hypothetical protein